MYVCVCVCVWRSKENIGTENKSTWSDDHTGEELTVIK